MVTVAVTAIVGVTGNHDAALAELSKLPRALKLSQFESKGA